MAEMGFRKADLNGDGLLNYDEMDETLRAERDKYDENKDGFIDLKEYKVYIQARVQQWQAQNGNGGGGGSGSLPGSDEEEPKPKEYRAGALPKELPAWFAQLDTDGDAQVGLYEWKVSGRSIEEFQKMDRNNDGFLTVQEVLRTQSLNGTMVASAGGRPDGGAAPGGAPAMGFGQPGGGFGRPGGGFGQPGGGFGQPGGGFGRPGGGFGKPGGGYGQPGADRTGGGGGGDKSNRRRPGG